MTGADDDPRLRASIERLAGAEPSAPPFDAMWRAANAQAAQRSTPRRVGWRLAAAFAVAAGAAGLAIRLAPPGRGSGDPASAARASDEVVRLWRRDAAALLSTWRSPTDDLLRAPDGAKEP